MSYYGSGVQVIQQPGYQQGQAAARALDASDGKIDGRYFGSPVVAGAGYATTANQQQFQYPSYQSGQVFGSQVVAGAGYATTAQPAAVSVVPQYQSGQVAARALDAADGRIDGRYFGSQVVAGAGYATTAPQYASQPVQYVQQSAPVTTQYVSSVPTQYVSTPQYVQSQAPVVATSYATAAPVQQVPAYQSSYVSPAPVVAGAYATTATPTTQVVQRPVQYVQAPTTQFVQAPAQFVPAQYSTSSGQAAARALDAADGRIDGRYYGAPVVAAPGYATTAPRVVRGQAF